MKITKRSLIFVVIILIAIVIGSYAFFAPKKSSVKSTPLAVTQRILDGMTEKEAQTKTNADVINCNCLGTEKLEQIDHYTMKYVCYGLVTGCTAIK